MTQWHVHHGDILDYLADGLLCSANPNLNLSGGVGGAFGLRYGYQMQSFLHEYLRDQSLIYIAPGNAVIAPPFDSPYVAVSHAVSIDAFYDTDADTILKTYDCAIHSLASRGCSTIAAACLGCGYGRVTVDSFEALSTRLFGTHYDGVKDITLVTTNADLVSRLEPLTLKPRGGPTDYNPPKSREELLRRYASGERNFPDTELSDADLAGVTLDGASFERWSWFSSANLEGASLRGTSFRECNVKCANFRHADLTGASFEFAAVEATEFDGAKLEGVSFVGATCYGYTIKNGDQFPAT